jgi:hypothetical protein
MDITGSVIKDGFPGFFKGSIRLGEHTAWLKLYGSSQFNDSNINQDFPVFDGQI